jgi:hypothetical protein
MLKPFYNKIYVGQNNKAIIVCPYCAEGKKTSVNRLRGSKHTFNVKCICKRTYKVFLEFRKKLRKETFLRGTYVNHSKMGIKSEIVILDISVAGLAFLNLDIFTFEEGDDISVKFTLDDEQKTVIKKNAVVRNIRQKRVGCEFDIYDQVF